MGHLPNFLVVGAHRAGTTATFMYLKQHPDIFIPRKKECRYFANLSPEWTGPGDDLTNRAQMTRFEDYHRLFDDVTTQTAIGDISPEYLYYHKESIPRILDALGKDTKIIINLRNPVSRTFSAYTEKLRDGFEKLTFDEALQAENKRMSEGWAWYWRYTRVSHYHEAVEDFLENFTNVRVVYFDEFSNNTGPTLTSLFRFLDIDHSFVPDHALPHNASGRPKSRIFHDLWWSLARPERDPLGIVGGTKRALRAIGAFDAVRNVHGRVALANLSRPEMSKQVRDRLCELYSDDVTKLGRLLGRDLNSWVT